MPRPMKLIFDRQGRSGVSRCWKNRAGTAIAIFSMPATDVHPWLLDRPLRILLVDDSPDGRALVRAYLRRTPCQLDDAENGEAAIRKFREQRYDLVLMDIQMPVMDGYAATRAIRKLEADAGLPRTPVVALTGSTLDEEVGKSREAGCDAHMAKPVRKARLLEVIGEVIAAGEVRPRAASDSQPSGPQPDRIPPHGDPASKEAPWRTR